MNRKTTATPATRLRGRVTANPVLCTTPRSRRYVTSFRITVRDHGLTTGYAVVAWNQTALNAVRHLRAGSMVEIVGYPQERVYTASSGLQFRSDISATRIDVVKSGFAAFLSAVIESLIRR